MFYLNNIFADEIPPTIGSMFQFTGDDVSTLAGFSFDFFSAFLPVFFLIAGLLVGFYIIGRIIGLVRSGRAPADYSYIPERGDDWLDSYADNEVDIDDL